MRKLLQAGLIAILAVVAVIYFAMPGRAEDDCRVWVADMQEDEGGPVLTAHACSDDSGEAYLGLGCFENNVRIDYDLAVGTDIDPDYTDVANIELVTDEGIETVPLAFQGLTAMFSGDTPADGNLVKLLKGSKSVLIRDADGKYPARTYSLKGSSAALTELIARCN